MLVSEYAIQFLRRSNLPTDVLKIDPENAGVAIDSYYRRFVVTEPGYNPEQEHQLVFMVDTGGKIKGHSIIGIGTMTSVISSVREIFRPAIIAGAFTIVIAHNHPGDDTTPSEADVQTTLAMLKASVALQMPLIDHIVLGASPGAFTSVRAFTKDDPGQWLKDRESPFDVMATLQAIFGKGRF